LCSAARASMAFFRGLTGIEVVPGRVKGGFFWSTVLTPSAVNATRRSIHRPDADVYSILLKATAAGGAVLVTSHIPLRRSRCNTCAR
jgi:hypothetical protein